MSFFNAMTTVFSSWNTGRQLGELDDRRLSDLGLNRYDLYAGRNLKSGARGALFSARRSERAKNWLR